MSNLATLPPARRADLVSWSAGNDGQHFVRNRANGDSFQLGEEEYFLLTHLDGRHTSDDIARGFAEHFQQPLSTEEFDDFLQLASERGLLQLSVLAANANAISAMPRPLEQAATVSANLRAVRLSSRLTSLSLKLASTALRWPAGVLSATAGRLDMFRRRCLDFVPRPDDIFIVTYPRSGTTWMQMILYQLTTDGRMDFPHIAEYCPWFESSIRSARGFELRPSPRLFKSHLPYSTIPKGPCKYLYVARDGKDVAVSCYHLMRAYNGYQGTFAEFFDRFLRGKLEFGCWFDHVRGWWARRGDPYVLFLTYDELSRDLEACIHRIIGFCGLRVPSERLPGILQSCTFGFMKEHESQFDPALEMLWERGVQLKSFLRNGKMGEGSLCLNADQQARFNDAFRKRLAPLSIPVGVPDRAAQA